MTSRLAVSRKTDVTGLHSGGLDGHCPQKYLKHGNEIKPDLFMDLVEGHYCIVVLQLRDREPSLYEIMKKRLC